MQENYLKELGASANATAVEKGWYDCKRCKGTGTAPFPAPAPCLACEGTGRKARELPTALMMMVSELCEALEDYRNGNNGQPLSHWGWYKECEKTDPKPEGFPMEMADALIRIVETCHHYGVDLDEAVRVKMEYNKSRPYRHGGKAC